MIRVAVDALGGDRAPEEIVAGAAEAASPGIEPVLYGPSGLAANGLPLVAASEAIEMDEIGVNAGPDQLERRGHLVRERLGQRQVNDLRTARRATGENLGRRTDTPAAGPKHRGGA
jgi:hypothetical protein